MAVAACHLGAGKASYGRYTFAGQLEPFDSEELSVSRFGQVPCVEPQKTRAFCVCVARFHTKDLNESRNA